MQWVTVISDTVYMRLSAPSSASLGALTTGIEWKQRLPDVLGKAGRVYGIICAGRIPPIDRAVVGSGGGGSGAVFCGVGNNVPRLPSDSLYASGAEAGLIKNENVSEKESNARCCREGRANRTQGTNSLRHGIGYVQDEPRGWQIRKCAN